MKNKILKIFFVLLILCMLVCSFTIPTFADTNQDGFNVDFNGGDTTGASTSITKMISAILNMVQIISIGVAIIMLIVLAIKYMSSAPNDKAEIKKHAIVYVVGAIVLFGATGILEIIKQFSGNIGDGTSDTKVN